MTNSRTFKILFRQLKARSKNGSAPIYARITVSGKRVEISTDLYHPVEEWDNKLSRAMGRTAQARALNEELDDIYAEIKKCYLALKREGRYITAQAIKARYLGTDHSNETLIGLSKYHFEKSRAKLAPGTLKNYTTTETYLRQFLIRELKTLILETLRYFSKESSS